MTSTEQLAADLNAMIERERVKRGMKPVLPLGLYFGLDEARYHADPGIGSTQIRQLTRNPQAYWYNSWMNPRRPPDEPSPAMIRGTALHRLVYMGEDYFGKHYMCGPDQFGMSSGEKATSTKKANALAESQGKLCIKLDDYERIAICAAMIKQNPKLGGVFEGGAPEVSLFWDVGGIRCKGRFDYLKARGDGVVGIGDLKSESNPFDIDFPTSCRNAVARRGYVEQASWYLDGAISWLARHIADGAVYGDADPDFLDRLRKGTQFGFAWVFYQIEGAPLTWSTILSPENPYAEKGRAANAAGLANYRRFLDHYGVEPWLLVEDPQELMIEDMPIWAQR
jgi:hypothetical protein